LTGFPKNGRIADFPEPKPKSVIKINGEVQRKVHLPVQPVCSLFFNSFYSVNSLKNIFFCFVGGKVSDDNCIDDDNAGCKALRCYVVEAEEEWHSAHS